MRQRPVSPLCFFFAFFPRFSCMQQEGTCKGKECEWASSKNNEKSGDGKRKYFPRSFFPIPNIFNFRKIFCQSSNFSSLKSKTHTQQARGKENEESNAQVLWPERERGGEIVRYSLPTTLHLTNPGKYCSVWGRNEERDCPREGFSTAILVCKNSRN